MDRNRYYYLSHDIKSFLHELDKGYVMKLSGMFDTPEYIMKKDGGFYLIKSDRCRYVETDQKIITSRNSAQLNLPHHKATRISLFEVFKVLMKHTWHDKDGDVFLHQDVAQDGLYLYDAIRLLD